MANKTMLAKAKHPPRWQFSDERTPIDGKIRACVLGVVRKRDGYYD